MVFLFCYTYSMNKDEKFNPKEPATLIIVVGMPGSGKSTYIEELTKNNPTSTLYDDYQGKAYNNDHDPRLSKHFGPLVSDLKQGKTVIVSDIAYCVPNELGIFLGMILGSAPNVVLDFKYFINDPEQCKKNVLQRNRDGRVQKELDLIDKLTKHYKLPSVQTIPVHTPRLNAD